MRGKWGWQPESLSGALSLRMGHCMRAGTASGKQSWVHFGLSRVGGRTVWDLSEARPAVSTVQAGFWLHFPLLSLFEPPSHPFCSLEASLPAGSMRCWWWQDFLFQGWPELAEPVSGFSLPPPPSASEPPRKKAQGGPGLLGMYLKCVQSLPDNS